MHTSPRAARGRRKRSSAATAGRQEVDAFGRARAPKLADLAALPFWMRAGLSRCGCTARA